MTVRVLVTAHPRREALAHALADRLCGAASVILDPAPERAGPAGPWRTMRHAILTAAAESAPASHLLLVQDDAVPALRALDAVEAIASVAPGQLVALFTPRHADQSLSMAVALRAADGGGLAYIGADAVGEWIPCVALLAPLRVLVDVAAVADAQGWTGVRADDSILAAWARLRGAGFYAAAPNIFDHDASVRSVANGPYVHRRTSILFLGAQEDASRVAWVPAASASWRPA